MRSYNASGYLVLGETDMVLAGVLSASRAGDEGAFVPIPGMESHEVLWQERLLEARAAGQSADDLLAFWLARSNGVTTDLLDPVIVRAQDARMAAAIHLAALLEKLTD